MSDTENTPAPPKAQQRQAIEKRIDDINKDIASLYSEIAWLEKRRAALAVQLEVLHQ